MTVRVQVSGLKELEAQLNRLRAATARAALQRAGVKAMQPMAELARSLAPEGEGYADAGELKASIVVATKASNADVGKAAYAGVKRDGGSDTDALAAMRGARREMRGERGKYAVDIFMGPRSGRSKDDVIKGFVQEFGNSRQEPRAYLRPAFDQDKGAMLERLKADIWAEVNKSLARAAARAAKG